MHRECAHILYSLVALGLATTALTAQPATVTIPDALSCTGCRIEFRMIAVLDVERAELAGIPIVATSLPSGRYALAEYPALAALFGSDGAFQVRLGRLGRGPRELEGAAALAATPGDSVLVLDAGSYRAMLVAADGRVAREFTLPGALQSATVLAWPTHVAMTGRVAGAGARQVHIVDFSGGTPTVRASFLEPIDPRAGGGDVSVLPVLATGARRALWAGDPLEYRITRWSESGTPEFTLLRKPSWFASRSSAWRGSPTVAPPPLLAAVVARDDERIVAYVRRASVTWRAAWASSARGGEVRSNSLALQDLYEVVLEVLDAQTGRVVTRAVAPAGVIHVLPNGQLVQYEERADGEIALRVLEPRLIER